MDIKTAGLAAIINYSRHVKRQKYWMNPNLELRSLLSEEGNDSFKNLAFLSKTKWVKSVKQYQISQGFIG